jgi:hypothetical protein
VMDVHAVVHKKKLDITLVVDEELLVATRKNVTGLLVGTVTDRGHGAVDGVKQLATPDSLATASSSTSND